MNDIDWTEVAPIIIGDVADELMSDRPSTERDDNRKAYGTRGSLVVDRRRGQFFDFEQQVGGGLFDMIKHLTDMDTKDAFNYLKENGFLDNTYQPKNKPRTRVAPKETEPDTNRYFDYGKRLWNESIAIPKNYSHPVRRWAAHRNLIHPILPFPDCIRYHEGTQYIIAAMTGLRSWLSPKRELKAFQVLAIDEDGNKRFHFDNGTNDKRCFGRTGGHALTLLGDPQSEVVNICEGLADGLAIYSRTEGMVIIAVTTIAKLAKTNMIDALKDRKVVVWSDNDEAGYMAAQTLMREMHHAGMVVDFIEAPPDLKDPADAARRDPFNIDTEEYQRRVKQFSHRKEGKREAFILCHNIARTNDA